jgi:hypothetical protein
MSAWSSRGMRRGIVLGVVSPLLVAACGSSAKQGGTIEGTAMPCGPFPTGATTVTVTITDRAGTQLAHQTIASPYHFRFGVKSGDYVVRAPASAPKTIHVQPGQTASVALISTCL